MSIPTIWRVWRDMDSGRKEYGRLVTQMTFNPVTGRQETITHTWEGGDRVRISYNLLAEVGCHPVIIERLDTGDNVNLSIFPIRVIKNNYWSCELECIRYRGLITDAIIILYKLTRWLDVIYRRAIITLYVWRLARYQQAAIPTWRDVNALRWLAEMIDKK